MTLEIDYFTLHPTESVFYSECKAEVPKEK